MENEDKVKRKIFWFYWIPLLFWMGFIFFLSSQPHESQNLQPLIRQHVPDGFVKERFSWIHFSYGGSEVSVWKLGVPAFVEFFVRKGAHLAVYFILGCLVFRLLRVWKKRPAVWLMGQTVLFCLAFAVSDEIHQSFTPQRTPMFADVLLDTAGALMGAFVYDGTLRIINRINMRKKPFS